MLISQAETALTVEIPVVEGTATGGADILSYNLQYKEKDQTDFISKVGEDADNLMLTISL